MFINFGVIVESVKIGFVALAEAWTKLPWKQIAKVAGAAGAGAVAGSAATAAAKDKAHEADLAEKDKVIQTQEARLSALEDKMDQMMSEECDENDSSLGNEGAAEHEKEALNSESEDATDEDVEGASDSMALDSKECA